MDHLTTEARNPASMNLDQLSPAELAALMNQEDHAAVAAVGSELNVIAECIEIIANRLQNGGRLIYVGAGTSGRLGVLDATECPPTFNTPPELVVGLIAGGPPALTRAVEGAEDYPEQGEKDLRAIGFNDKDVLVGIATSGRTPYVIGACQYARSIGAATIGLVCNRDSELHHHVDRMICPVVGPEILSGSTRLKAGTATKLVLNTLTTGAMVRMGKTFGNLMVDLRATNNKLKARTNRIVRLVTGVDEASARELLTQANGELKTALVMQAAGLDANAARQALTEAGGRVGPALKKWRQQPMASVDSSLVVGIDGGGTRTVAILAEGERIIGRGETGPSNLQAIGLAAALESLNQAIGRAFAAAGRTRTCVGAICLGLAGADRGPEKKILQEWVKQHHIADWCEVTSDGSLLLAAGTKEGSGIAAISGTGSIAVGRSKDGAWTRSGGWGYLLGDEGSGYAIALDALNAVTRAADGRGGATPLSDSLLRAMHLQKPQDLIAAVYRGSWDRTAIAALAPIVFQVAESDDEIALRIVERQAGEMAHVIAAAAKNLQMNEFPLALAGGTLLHSEFYRNKVLEALHTYQLKIESIELVSEPAVGAVRLARERLHWTV